jgi:hypothetical protein
MIVDKEPIALQHNQPLSRISFYNTRHNFVLFCISVYAYGTMTQIFIYIIMMLVRLVDAFAKNINVLLQKLMSYFFLNVCISFFFFVSTYFGQWHFIDDGSEEKIFCFYIFVVD